MARWNRAVVTGASSGIGEALARRLSAEGTHVVLVARTEATLHSLADQLGGDDAATVLVADLASAADVEAVAAVVGGEPVVDLVINNAGFGLEGPVAEADPERQLSMIDVNVRALTRLTHAALAAMVPRGEGNVLNVSSVGGYVPAPSFAVYGASKAYVSSFSQAVHTEARSHGVGVTCIAPGFTRTDFQDRAGYDSSAMPNFLWQSADEVASIALDATDKGKAMVVPGAPNKVMVTAIKPLPGALQRAIAARF